MCKTSRRLDVRGQGSGYNKHIIVKTCMKFILSVWLWHSSPWWRSIVVLCSIAVTIVGQTCTKQDHYTAEEAIRRVKKGCVLEVYRLRCSQWLCLPVPQVPLQETCWLQHTRDSGVHFMVTTISCLGTGQQPLVTPSLHLTAFPTLNTEVTVSGQGQSDLA